MSKKCSCSNIYCTCEAKRAGKSGHAQFQGFARDLLKELKTILKLLGSSTEVEHGYTLGMLLGEAGVFDNRPHWSTTSPPEDVAEWLESVHETLYAFNQGGRAMVQLVDEFGEALADADALVDVDSEAAGEALGWKLAQEDPGMHRRDWRDLLRIVFIPNLERYLKDYPAGDPPGWGKTKA